MITFTKIPTDFTPATDSLPFAIACDEPSDVELLVVDAALGEVVGRKRLYGITEAQVDIAPYVAPFDDVVPLAQQGSTIIPAPVRQYYVQVGDLCSEPVSVSCNRVLPLAQSVISTMGTERRIAHGECDELRIISRPAVPVRAEVVTDEGYTLSIDYTSSPGYVTLLLSTADLPATTRTADVSIFCDEMEVATLHYTFIRRFGEPCHVAWLSEVGSIERYTFPCIGQISREATRTECRSATGESFGVRNRTDVLMHLTSEIESRSTIASLSGIVSSPEVWMWHATEGWQRVEVLSNSSVVRSFGSPDRFEADIRIKRDEVAR